ncbi:MAG: SGNH/GDSL hydrolase family protein [Sandaracinaceae bacterium]
MSRVPNSARRERTRPLGFLLLLVLLFCCEEGAPAPSPPPASAQAPEESSVEASPPPASGPATRIVPPPPITSFTPSLVTRLRAIRAARDNRHDNVFMKVGDSSTVSRGFLECLSDPDEVELDGRGTLTPTLTHFRRGRAGTRSPFRRDSLAAHEGWSARHVLSGRPSPLLRELNAIRPRFALVMNGGNDVEGRDDYVYATRMMRIVELLVGQGVIPVLNSIPPRTDDAEANGWVERYNQVSWAVAAAFQIPYLDYHQVMRALPRQGLAGDGVHPNIFIENNRGHACRFDEEGLQYGHNARNLLALQGLDRLRRTVVEEESAPDPEAPELSGRGTVASPFEVRRLPFAQLADTTETGSEDIDGYPGCDAEQDEGGRELVYRLVVEEELSLRVLAVGRGDADLDVHLLRDRPIGESCIARGDREVVSTLTAGTYYVVIDTFVDERPRAGEVLVLLAPAH